MTGTLFKLNGVESRVGRIALVTVDNGEDHTKPTTLGRSALASASAVVEELRRRLERRAAECRRLRVVLAVVDGDESDRPDARVDAVQLEDRLAH